MKPKISFGKGGLKGFLVQHSEKAIFGVVLLLVAVFIFSSATQEGYELDKLPEDLQREAATARGKLDEDHWDALAPERVSRVRDYPTQAKVARQKIDGTGYGFTKGWDVDPSPTESKRSDPQMFAPINVEAEGAIVAVAIRTKSSVDPFANDENAVVKEVEEKKPRKKKKPKSNYMGGYGEEMGGYGEEMGGYGEEMGGYGEEMGGYGEEMGGYGAGMGGSAAGKHRTLGSFYREQYVKGFKGGGSGGGMMPGTRPGVGPSRTVGKSFAVVGVKALVPYEKQWEEFEQTLAAATGYNPSVDVPRYLSYIAERAEVPADPDAPLQWKTISWSDVALRATRLFGGVPRDVVDPAYTIPNALTMPIPPILIRDYEALASHSEVPKAMPRAVGPTLPEDEGDEEDPSLMPSGDELEAGGSARPQGPPRGPGGGYGAAGAGGYGAGAGGYGAGAGGYGAGAGGYGAGGYGEEYGAGGYGEEYGAGGYGEEMGGYGEEMGGYGEEYGAGGYGASSPMGQRQPLAKYKLIRFFDFSAEAGKSYRYRVCVRVEDPNRPQNPGAEPSKRILKQSVLDRLAKIIAEDEKKAKETSKPYRTDFIQTEWSEPSDIVTIDTPEWYAAGGVTKGKTIPLMRDGPEVQISEPSGQLVAAVWDISRATEIPVEKTVYRGSYLNFKTDADVLNPLTLQLKTAKDYDFATDALVVDLRGGEKLIVDVVDAKTKEEVVYNTPGEYLVVDGNGNLIACNEIDNVEEYRRLTFVDEAADAAAAATSSDYGGYMGGEEDYGGGEEEGYMMGGEY